MSDDLTAFVDAEFFITGAKSPADEQKLLAALQNVPGIAKISVAQGRVDVHYDPITVTKKEIGEKIAAAGYQITDVEAAASSPVVDGTA